MGVISGWVTIVLLVAGVIAVVAVALSVHHRKRNSATRIATAGMLGMDDIFHPSASEARTVWEAEQELPIPAPTPDKGRGVIEASGRIVIEVSAGDEPT